MRIPKREPKSESPDLNPFAPSQGGDLGESQIEDDEEFELKQEEIEYNLVFLTGSQMQAEVDEADMEQSDTPLQSTPSSTIPGHPSTPHSGWQVTPPNHKCRCKKVAYVVFHGRRRGIYTSWNAVEESVQDYPEARYKGYHSVEDAEQAWETARDQGLLGPVAPELDNHHFIAPPFTPCSVVHGPASGGSSRSPHPASTPRPGPSTQNTPRRGPSTQNTPRPGPSTLNTPRRGGGATPHPRDFQPSATPCSSPQVHSQGDTHQNTQQATSSVRRPAGPQFLAAPRISALAGSSTTVNSLTAWYVVSVGLYPGVYRGRATAVRNAGSSAEGRIHEAPQGLDQANEMFVDAFMNNSVRRLARLPAHPSPFSRPPVPILPPDEEAWWVVPTGNAPGVYLGRLTARRVAGDRVDDMIKCSSDRHAHSTFVDRYMGNQIEINHVQM